MFEDFVRRELSDIRRHWGVEEGERALEIEDAFPEVCEAVIEALMAVFVGFVGCCYPLLQRKISTSGP